MVLVAVHLWRDHWILYYEGTYYSKLSLEVRNMKNVILAIVNIGLKIYIYHVYYRILEFYHALKLNIEFSQHAMMYNLLD